jgi:hypothetical protein
LVWEWPVHIVLPCLASHLPAGERYRDQPVLVAGHSASKGLASARYPRCGQVWTGLDRCGWIAVMSSSTLVVVDRMVIFLVGSIKECDIYPLPGRDIPYLAVAT